MYLVRKLSVWKLKRNFGWSVGIHIHMQAAKNLL